MNLTEKDKKLITLASKGGNDASLVLFDDISSLEEKLNREIKNLEQSILSLRDELERVAQLVKAAIERDIQVSKSEIDLTETNKLIKQLANKKAEPVDVNIDFV